MDRLDTYSKAIEDAAKRGDEERRAHQESLGEPFFFQPYAEPAGHGIGYFRVSDTFIHAYRKYSNGYERYPCGIYERWLVEKLAKEFAK